MKTRTDRKTIRITTKKSLNQTYKIKSNTIKHQSSSNKTNSSDFTTNKPLSKRLINNQHLQNYLVYSGRTMIGGYDYDSGEIETV